MVIRGGVCCLKGGFADAVAQAVGFLSYDVNSGNKRRKMSIAFKCPNCDNELHAEDDMKGKRGKCPQCGRLIKVPEYSSHELVMSENGYFKSQRLNELFQEFLDEYDEDIKKCHVGEERGVSTAVEVYTDGGRSQFVALGVSKVNDQDEFLMSYTVIGKNPKFLNFPEILVDLACNMPLYPTYTAHVQGDQLMLFKITNLKHVDSQVFYESIIAMAKYADSIEEKYYDNDAN